MKENVNKEIKKENIINDIFVDPISINTSKKATEEINKAREDFARINKKVMTINRIVAISFMIIMIAFCALVYFYQQLIYLLLGIVVCYFIGVFVFTKLSRKKLETYVNKYISIYALNLDSFAFNLDEVTNLKLGFKDKPDETKINKLDFVNEVCHVGSRDVIKGQYENRNFEVADVSIKTGSLKDKRTQKIVFVGKVFSFEYMLKDEGRTLLYLKGCGDAEPNKLEDVNEVEIPSLKNWKVYSSHNNVKKIINDKMIRELNKFSTDKILNDIIISIEKDTILIGLSYSDDFMIIPLKDAFKEENLSHYKEDIKKVFSFEKAISQNDSFNK